MSDEQTPPIPTHEQAIASLVELDVSRWGESEREAIQEMRGRLTYALALNALAYYDVDNVNHELAAEARRVLRAQDRASKNGALL